MPRIAVFFANGFEESEALTIVDVLRRAGMEALSVGIADREVLGAHGVRVQADALLAEVADACWDMAVVPGGYGGVDALMDDAGVLRFLRALDAREKYVAAICAGPRVLDKAGVLRDRSYTCYPGQEALIPSGKHRQARIIRDGNLITAAGPALCYAFAYALIDALGGDSMAVKNRMVYFNAFDEGASRRDFCPERVERPEGDVRVAVLMKEGFEEGETVSIVDILRRLDIQCATFADTPWVKGMHGMMVAADEQFGSEIEGYDVVVLPGGRPGGQNLKDDPRVLDLLRRFDRTPGKRIAALCSGTTVLAAAGVIEGKRMTGYTGYAEKLPGAIFEDTVTVADQNLVTSQGPATGFPFAFRLAEVLGRDTRIVRSRLMYDYAGGRG